MKDKKIFLLLFFSTFFLSCFSELQEPIIPNWNITLTVPLTKEFTLGEILDKSDNTKFSSYPEQDSLIYYRANLKINPININNSEYINLNSSSKNGIIKISDIKFSLNEKFIFNNKINDIFTNIPTNTYGIIPTLSNFRIEKDINLSSFNLISVDTSTLIIEIQNNFPFDFMINNLILQNNHTNNKSEIYKKSNILIEKNSTLTINEKILKKDLYNNQQLILYVSTTGSNGSQVFINPDYSLIISFDSKDNCISYAEASFTEQKYNFSITRSLFNYDNEIKINEAKIKKGILNVFFFNYSNLNGYLISETQNIKYSSNNFNTGKIFIPEKNTASKSYILNNYIILPYNSTDIILDNTFLINSTNNNFVKIYGSDSITYKIELKNIELETFSGSITSDIKNSLYLPKEDINKYFNGNIKIENVEAKLYVNNGCDIPFKLSNCKISGFNKATNKIEQMNINDAVVLPKTRTNIPIDNKIFTSFINNFTLTNSLPDYFDYSSKINITTNNQSYFLSDNDTIGGDISIYFPFYFSTNNLTYTDSIDYEISESDREKIDKINYGKLTINVTNMIPLNGKVKLRFYNSNTKQYLSFPINLSNLYFNIPSAEKNSQGLAIKEKTAFFYEELTKDHIKFLRDANKCFLDFTINTENNNPSYVKREDRIKFNIITEFGYTVK